MISAFETRSQTLAAEGIGLNRTGVAEVLAEEGFPRLWPRPPSERGTPRREQLPRAELLEFATLPARAPSRSPGSPWCCPTWWPWTCRIWWRRPGGQGGELQQFGPR